MILEKIWMGIAFAAPIGPVSAEALRRGLMGGFSPAFKVKFGAAIGDTIFLIAAIVGITTILKYPLLCQTVALFGSSLLLYTGYKNINKARSPNTIKLQSDDSSLKGGMLLGLGIAITNPFAVAFWLGTFSALISESSAATGSATMADLMVNMYIVVGILLWDVLFCTLVGWGKKYINDLFVRIINAAAGAALCGYGVYFGTSAFMKIFF